MLFHAFSIKNDMVPRERMTLFNAFHMTTESSRLLEIGNGSELLHKCPSFVAICEFVLIIEYCRLGWVLSGVFN